MGIVVVKVSIWTRMSIDTGSEELILAVCNYILEDLVGCGRVKHEVAVLVSHKLLEGNVSLVYDLPLLEVVALLPAFRVTVDSGIAAVHLINPLVHH